MYFDTLIYCPKCDYICTAALVDYLSIYFVYASHCDFNLSIFRFWLITFCTLDTLLSHATVRDIYLTYFSKINENIHMIIACSPVPH